MRSLRPLALSFVVLIFAALPNAGAEAQQSLEREVQAAARWNEQASALTADFLAIIGETTALDEVSYAYLEGRIDQANALIQADRISQSLKERVARIEKANDALPPPPETSDPSLRAQLGIIVSYLAELRGQIGDIIHLSENAFQAALNDDQDAFQILFLKQINLYVVMGEGENRVIRQRMGVLEKTVPEYHLMAVYYALNDAMIDLLRLTDRLVSDGPDPTAITNFTTSARISISESDNSVARGRDATVDTIRQIRAVQPANEEERAFIARLLRALDVYHDEFSIEERISLALEKWADDLSALEDGDLANGPSEEEFAAWFEVLEKLIGARLELQNKRVSIIAGTQ